MQISAGAKGFLFFATLALAVSFYAMQHRQRGNMHTTLLRVAFPANDAISDYDPSKIYYAHQYIILENLYSQLVGYDTKGEIVSGIAERFEWVGNEVRFYIRRGLKTVDGDEITASDAELSLKRLFILQSNTHGDISRALCGKNGIKALSEKCENMRVEDDYTLVLAFPQKDPFLFSMLTSVDFSVLPRKSYDHQTLKIIDYRKTSGPYYVEKSISSEPLELAANPSHFLYSDKMPVRITLIPSRVDKKSIALTLFKEGKVDMLTTAETAGIESIKKYAEGTKDVEIFKTIPIELAALTFTPSGVSRHTVSERFVIASLIKRALLSSLTAGGAESTIQLFPPFGQGALTEAQLASLNARFENLKDSVFMGKFTAWNLPKDSWPELQKIFPNADLKYVMAIPGHADYKALGLEEPDLFFHRTDTSIKEDISFFSYYMSGYFFSIHGEKGASWVKKYSRTENLGDRMKMLNRMHYETLSEAITIPLTFSPYMAIVKKPWRFDFFNLHAGTTFWRMRCN